MLTDLVRDYLHAVAIDDVLQVLADVAEHDRYQASLGLDAAASVVADAAEAAGLSDVAVRRWPADGTAQWWSWRAPLAWTPLVARLEARSRVGTVVIDHATQPFAIATYSAATARGGVDVPLTPFGADPACGGLALVDAAAYADPATIGALVARGALGFVTDGPSRADRAGHQSGRIELAPGSPLLAFSVTPTQFAELSAHAQAEATARVRVEVDRSAGMPVVTGVIPGDLADEVWLTAHVCHPRPGANDNASGVAALVGVAAAHRALLRSRPSVAPRRTIRFVWGPEFLGTAAMLHDAVGAGQLPVAAIDLDMVGEDQAECGSPFVVESPFDEPPSVVAPLAEAVVDEVFARTAQRPGRWVPSPFVGFSDHALFADRSVRRPAVQLCHVGDRYNHSAADTLDKVSPVEMLRSTTAAATLAHLLASEDALSRAELLAVVADWCERRTAGARATAARLGGDSAWARDHLAYVEAANDATRAVAGVAPPYAASPISPAPGPPVRRRWAGPVNVRALLADLPAARRSDVDALLAQDKRNYSLLLNFALRVDDERSIDEIVRLTSLGSGRPIDPVAAEVLAAALVESGWVEVAPQPAATAGRAER